MNPIRPSTSDPGGAHATTRRASGVPLDEVLRLIGGCMLTDRARLLSRVRSVRADDVAEKDRILREIDRSRGVAAERAKRLPRPEFPIELPVSERKSDIARAISEHQVVVLCGETGSGKTTQLPKICLELGRGVHGMIGHTQPRRIAARSVAARIADELRTPLGRDVGYKVRFGDKTSPGNFIKVMTDGILLAETQADRDLLQYDTIIIDEAHERSLNIDFLLGYLKLLLPRRPDLKVIVTSATIDPERFARHFSRSTIVGDGSMLVAGGRERPPHSNGAEVPILMVSGRTFPVEVIHRPTDNYEDADDPTLPLLNAVDECASYGDGDILCFFSGEREIREAAEALRKHHPADTAILPLYARLSTEEQNRVFEPHRGRRIILATNVAETSLTVPGIRYVVDTGLARINRYSPRTRVQRLEIEAISRASADQRKGRCGRIGPGVCIRLYSEEDYRQRSEFTDPEIIRANLASVILQMKSLRLGRVEDFPFVEPPDGRMIKDGYDTLRELGAADDRGELTQIGWKLAKLPIDPRIGRMILAADAEGSLSEVLVIAAALSTQDPRDRRTEHQQQADEAHAQWRNEESDFISILNLWKFYREQYERLSRSKLVKAMRQNYLSYVRMREWDEVHKQLHALCAEMKLRFNDSKPAPYDAVHRALLTGMLSGIGRKGEQAEYSGAFGQKFNIFPGSGLFKTRPRWVMTSELVRTTKLYARSVAKIDPAWIERSAAHLVTRSYSDPHWDYETSRVLAYERVQLFGVEIVSGRRVHYGPIEPALSRGLFIHHALVMGEYRTSERWFRNNRELQAEIEHLEIKTRRRDLLVDTQTRHAFYDKRLPKTVYCGQTFEKWRKEAERENRHILFMSRDDLMLKPPDEKSKDAFPDEFVLGRTPQERKIGTRLKIEYRFQHGEKDDGVTMVIPVEALNQVDPVRADWLVPGLIEEKIAEMIRSVPKSQRRHLGPPNEMARQVLGMLTFGDGPLSEQVKEAIETLSGVPMPKETWAAVTVPDHLRMNFRVVGENGKIIAEGRDVETLQRSLGAEVQRSFRKIGGDQYTRDGVTKWDFGDLPEKVEVRRGTMTVVGYPALVDMGKDAGLRVIETRGRAANEHRAGVRRLFLIRAGRELKHHLALRTRLERMCVQWATLGSANDLKADLLGLIAERAFLGREELPRTAADFESRVERGWNVIPDAVDEVGTLAEQALNHYQALRLVIDSPAPTSFLVAFEDVENQVSNLIYKGFLVATPREWLPHLPRYLSAARARLAKLPGGGVAKDARISAEAAPFWNAYVARATLHERAGVFDPELTLYRWMIEEFRVQLFAQELRTIVPVSVKRLQDQWSKIGKP